MKHLSDDDITKELEVLGQSFRPSTTQKEKLHRQIFQPNRNKKRFHIQTWPPVIISLILLFSVGIGTFVLINNEYIGAGESSGKGELITDVTASWEGVFLTQTSQTSPTNYIIYFNEHSLIIEDDYTKGQEYDPDLSEENKEKKLARYKIKEVPLVAGEYTNYSIKKQNDIYTIKVIGKQGFTLTLEKVAPRRFVSEEGIEYSTPIYVE